MIQTDILVVGSGAAGLFYALKSANACPQKKITIITKASPDESNTKYAQGGVAVVLDEVRDNFVDDNVGEYDWEDISLICDFVNRLKDRI